MLLLPRRQQGQRVPFAVMQPPFPGNCDALLEDETVDVIVNGESSRLPGGLSVVTKENSLQGTDDEGQEHGPHPPDHPGP